MFSRLFPVLGSSPLTSPQNTFINIWAGKNCRDFNLKNIFAGYDG
jgi:hypothetical protein